MPAPAHEFSPGVEWITGGMTHPVQEPIADLRVHEVAKGRRLL